MQLELITKKLHLVSQTADTGIANALMSIKLSEEMVGAYRAYCIDNEKGPAYHRQIADALSYLLKSWNCQRDWLVSYKARKDTAMNFVSYS